MADELPIKIIEVWKHNLDREVGLMSDVIKWYPFVAMDTKFPGKNHVAKNPDGPEYKYRNMKENVDDMKIIQIGITLFDEAGNLPNIDNKTHPVWQFNFSEFDVNKDACVPSSLNLLRSAGIQFERNLVDGISASRFAEVLMSSGLVLNYATQWVTFHGGFDCGYWIRMLTNKALPGSEAEFYRLLEAFFPVIYDLKHVARCKGVHGGLVNMAIRYNVVRTAGNAHQAGSDSYLTCKFYTAFKKRVFGDSRKMDHAGVLDFL